MFVWDVFVCFALNMISVIVEQRILVKFHMKLWKTAYPLSKEVYGDKCLLRVRVFKYSKHLKNGQMGKSNSKLWRTFFFDTDGIVYLRVPEDQIINQCCDL